VDVAAVMALAREKGVRRIFPEPKNASDTFFVRVGVVRDSAFTFYYPENLEALAAGGAEIVRCSALDAAGLPDRLDALYIGGGFPETHAHALAANRPFLDSLRQAARNGLPVFAECGGLMLLSQSIWWQGKRYRMAEALPFDVEVCPGPPQGHGYVDLRVDTPNPYFPVGTTLRGHEFHYSRIMNLDRELTAVCQVTRGTGCGNRRDGLVVNNVWAAYTHFHALGAPEWASGFLQAARRHASGREGF
jgi:cobyrinic acid a,c-diamide synthase